MTAAPSFGTRSGFRSGHVAGSYRLLGLLGEGGMGEVYEAVHVTVGRKFAVKVLRGSHSADSDASLRFEREARVVGALECEQIVSVLDFGNLDDTTPYLVMERLRGDDLKSVLKVAQQLPLERTLALALDVCRGLDVAHRAGLIHRDLKPANLFLCRSSSGAELCKILDFGIARQTGATTSVTATVVGTARYMAPEQILSGGAVTPATDLYALGAIIYECLSGKRLHDGDTIEAVLFSVIHQEPKPLSELAPNVPPRLAQIVARLTSKRPEDRFQRAVEVYAALRPLLPGTQRYTRDDVSADSADMTLDAELERTGVPVSYSAAPRARQHRLRVLGSVAAFAALGAVAATGYLWGQHSAQPNARAARNESKPPLACPAPVVPIISATPASLPATIAPPRSERPRSEKPKPRPVAATPVPASPASSPSPPPKSDGFVAQSPYQVKATLASSGATP